MTAPADIFISGFWLGIALCEAVIEVIRNGGISVYKNFWAAVYGMLILIAAVTPIAIFFIDKGAS